MVRWLCVLLVVLCAVVPCAAAVKVECCGPFCKMKQHAPAPVNPPVVDVVPVDSEPTANPLVVAGLVLVALTGVGVFALKRQAADAS